MKPILILSILFWVTALPALGELTDADFDKIRLIVKEEVKTEIAASEKRLKEYVDSKIDGVEKSLNTRIDATNTRIDSVDKNLNRVWLMIIALIGLITATIAIPQIIIANTEKRREKDLAREYQALQTEIQQLRGRLEALENTPS